MHGELDNRLVSTLAPHCERVGCLLRSFSTQLEQTELFGSLKAVFDQGVENDSV